MRVLLLVVSLALCCTAGLAATPAAPGITPVQAELTADLNARLLKVGSSVFARVTVDWQSSDCVLRSGAVLEAHVSSVIPFNRVDKRSEVDLAFTGAQCGERKMGAFELMLAALAAPPQNSDLGILSDSLPVLTTGSGGLAAMKRAYAANIQLETAIYQFPLIPHLQMGTVAGIRGLKLSVGTGLDNSSVLTSKNHDVSLEKHTLLLLVPAQGTIPRAPVSPGGAQPTSPDDSRGGGTPASDAGTAVQAPPLIDDIEVCEPPQCSLALPSGHAIDEAKAEAAISIRELGYAARPQRMMNRFDNDEALAWLGPRQLLVAFNPHILASRHVLGPSGPTVRVIRAALVDTQTHRVSRTVDWELPDNRQYLWPLAASHVLVHVGSELRVYGEGLKIQNRLSLEGPLAFVRVTPDGSFIAVGVLHERHSPELHAQLSESLGEDPEEDVNVVVLNSNFETIAQSTVRSGVMAPTLLNEGQAKLLALPNKRYRVAMLTWDDKSWTVARFHSSCTPELSSIAPDLIFLLSCDKTSEGREYRVLRPDGKLALKGDAMPNELGHAALGSANREAFVVKVVQSSSPVGSEEPFSAADFLFEELRVYRATDGKRLLGVRVASPSPSRDGYALSPDGSQLAVLTRDRIAIYSVPGK